MSDSGQVRILILNVLHGISVTEEDAFNTSDDIIDEVVTDVADLNLSNYGIV